MTKQIDENSEWIKSNLLKLWGENQADYFSNPSRLVNRIEEESELDSYELVNKLPVKNRIAKVSNYSKTSMKSSNYAPSSSDALPQTRGLYAYTIWENIRDDTNNKLKDFNLEKELQETMNTFLRNRKSRQANNRLAPIRRSVGAAEDQIDEIDDETKSMEKEMIKMNRHNSMSKLKSTRALRNDIELMYRSSRMNEERVNTLKAMEGSFGYLNEMHGKDSIVKYLPPINLNEVSVPKISSETRNAIVITSPLMRHEYKKQIQKKLAEQQQSIDYYLIKNESNRNKNVGSNRGVKNVRLNFLVEKPSRDYLSKSESESMIPTESVNSKLDESENEKSLVIYKQSMNTNLTQAQKIPKTPINKNSSSTPPPLTINALMEYKPLIKAPGLGDFDNGRPKLFKVENADAE